MATHNLFAYFDEPLGLVPPAPHKVFTKTDWADPWTEEEYLHCNWASFALSPGISTAELSWRYGRGKRPDLPDFLTILPDDGARHYVKIEWTNATNRFGEETSNPVWHGIVNGIGDQAGGVRQNAAGTYYGSGQQVLQCVGLEKLLEDTTVRTGHWYDYDGASIHVVERGLTFNDYRADGTPGGNMTPLAPVATPVFSGKVLDDDAFWSTRDIVDYLVKYHAPKSKNGVGLIPFAISAASLNLLSAFVDRPYLPSDGRSVRELLNQLLAVERMLSWRLDVVGNTVVLVVCPWNGDLVALPDAGNILLPNERRWRIDNDVARGDAMRVLSHAHAVDRVRIRGREATATFSVSHADGTLAAGWTSALESEYEAGASGAADYAALSTENKRQRNQESRGVDKLKEVFSRFKVPHAWDYLARNGEGGGGANIHAAIAGAATDYKPSKREFHLLRTVPLRDGYSYQSITSAGGHVFPPVKVSEGPFNHLPPLVVIKHPDAARYSQVEKVGIGTGKKHAIGKPNRSWSGYVQIPEKDRAIVIGVSGEVQHVIAGSDFTPLAVDLPQTSASAHSLGAWDWKTMICTVAAQLDAYCEGVYPQFPSVPNVDAVREVVLQASDTFRLDWLVPGTVIGITNAGALVRSALGGWINDDRKKLEDRARMAYEWYGVERRAVTWSSSRVNGSIRPGDYVVKMGGFVQHAVNSVVTEVRIDCNQGKIDYRTDVVADFGVFVDGVARSRHRTEKFG